MFDSSPSDVRLLETTRCRLCESQFDWTIGGSSSIKLECMCHSKSVK